MNTTEIMKNIAQRCGGDIYLGIVAVSYTHLALHQRDSVKHDWFHDKEIREIYES